ncbi:MAG: LacI family transcriptional regulator [Lachnospiraceae bacterium]|nr:LacI family transcriptional regulator [Lachnospiraceae bacterium]
MVSIKDISEACGVSVATVSKALNDQRDVGAATKARIKEMARQMGYVPNAASRSLKTKHSYNIGVLYKEDSDSGLAHSFYAKVLDSIKKTAEEHGYDITFVNNSNNSGGRGLSYLEHCRYRNFDGVAVVCVDFDDPQIQEVIKSDIPSVVLDYAGAECDAVLSDNYNGVRELVRYAYEQGHRRIAFIHGVHSYVTDERIRGFKDECKELGINIPDTYLLESPYLDTMSAHLKTDMLLRMDEPPTCILYPDDFSAIGGLNSLYKKGNTVPDDISIMGFDGIELSRYISPSLTTYVQDTDRLGSEMAIRLLKNIQTVSNAENTAITVSGYVFHGESVGLI